MKISQALILVIFLIICHFSFTQEVLNEDQTLETQIETLLAEERAQSEGAEVLRRGRPAPRRFVTRSAAPKFNHAAAARAAAQRAAAARAKAAAAKARAAAAKAAAAKAKAAAARARAAAAKARALKAKAAAAKAAAKRAAAARAKAAAARARAAAARAKAAAKRAAAARAAAARAAHLKRVKAAQAAAAKRAQAAAKARAAAKKAAAAKAAAARAKAALAKAKAKLAAAHRAKLAAAAAAKRRAEAAAKAKALAAARAKAAADAKRAAVSYTCSATGDPHMVNFDKQPYENQFEGDLIVFNKPGFRCDTRQMRWNNGGAFVNGRIACQIAGQHYEIFTPTDVRLNRAKAPTGTKDIKGTKFTWNGSNIEISRAGTTIRIQVAATGSPKWYMNVWVTTNSRHGVTGLCNGKYDSRVKGTVPPRANPSLIDGKSHPIKRGKPIKFTKAAIAWATGICKKRGLKGEALKDCIFDVAASHSKKVAEDLAKAQKLRDHLAKVHAARRLAAAKAAAKAAKARADAAKARAAAAKRAAALRKAKEAEAKRKRAEREAQIKAAREKAEALRKAARIAKAKELERKRTEAAKEYNCYATGDPHMRTFDGKLYENQFTGEFILFRRAGIRCDVRQEYWNPQKTVAVNVRLACKIAGDHIEAFGPNDVRVNGKKINNGNLKIISGTQIAFTGSQVTISYAGSTIRSQLINGHTTGPLPRSYQNIYVTTKGRTGVDGLCNAVYDSRNKATKPPVANPSIIDGKGGFRRPNPHKKFGAKAVAWATGICKRRKLTGDLLKDCIYDVAETHDKKMAEAEKKMAELKAKLKKQIEAAAKKRAAAAARARAAAAKARAAAAKAKAKAAALRKAALAKAKAAAEAAKKKLAADLKRKTYNCHATGDPHMSNFDGKTYENQFSGEFKLFHKNAAFKCDVRQEFWNPQKTVTVNKRVACKVGKTHVELYGLNDVRINRKKFAKVTQKLPGGGTVTFDGRNFKVENKNGDNVRAQVAGTVASFYMNVYATARGHKGTGLCNGVYDSRVKGTKPPVAKPSLIDGKGCKFGKPKHAKLNPKAIAWATKICKARKLTGKFLKACIFDTAVTHKKRFAELEVRAKRMADKLKRHKEERAKKIKREIEAAKRRVARAKALKAAAAKRKQAKKIAKKVVKKAKKAKASARKAAAKARKTAKNARKAARKAAKKPTPKLKKVAQKKLIKAQLAKLKAVRKLVKAKKLKNKANKLKRKASSRKSAKRVKKNKNTNLKMCYQTTSSNDFDVQKVAKSQRPTKSDEKDIIGKAF